MKAIAAFLISVPIVLSASRSEAATVPAVQTANGSAYTWREFIGANQSASVGWSFSVGAQDQEVDALGIFDAGMDGLADAHPVAIWTSSGTLLAQATVASGTAGTLVGSYRYAAIAPITLAAGQAYVVGTYFGPVADICGSACGDALLALATESYAPGITFVQSRQTLSVGGAGSLAFPSVNAGVAEGVFGPNLLLAVPATPSIALSTNSLDFGARPTGSLSSATVSVTNSGTADLVISSLSDPGAPFAITGGSCTALPATLPPAASCQVVVRFTSPGTTGSFASSFDIVSNAPSSPNRVTLAASSAVAAIPAVGSWGLALQALLLGWLGCRLRSRSLA